MFVTTHRASRIQFAIANEQRAPKPKGEGSVVGIPDNNYGNTPIHTRRYQEALTAVNLGLTSGVQFDWQNMV
jgi:hypothetical protein